MYTRGILNEYSNIILPFSKGKIQKALLEIESNKNDLSETERRLLDKYLIKFDVIDSSRYQSLSDFPSSIIGSIIADQPKYFYNYKDSSANFYINPVFNYTFLLNKTKSTSLLEYGGKINGSFMDYFGFLYEVSNGTQIGDRSVAEYDKRIEQSYTFNHTEIHYFDNTEGYAKFHYGLIDFQAGRERVLIGQGNIDKLILSDNPPLFDFIKFDVHYKSLSYNFLHGWLVQPTFNIYNPVTRDSVKNQNPKYIASTRLGINPNPDLEFGISQVIIYSNRPVELAYLNPFLFWESAQRSMNDLDNSFLVLDGKFRIGKGIVMYCGVTIDDIDFKEYFSVGWNTLHNRTAWQLGLKFSEPFSVKNSSLEIEYLQLRPYIYSHDGLGESLVYTNNGYLLGPDILPNSEKFSVLFNLWIRENIFGSINYSYSLHGDNVYNSNGILIKNVGGDPFQPSRVGDSPTASLLDGIRSYASKLNISLNYEIGFGLYANGFMDLNWNMKVNTLQKYMIYGVAFNMNFE
jgi:hypothetical protein